LLVGNGCWGGDAHTVICNGPNSDQNDIDMYFGKGLVSKKLYEQIYDTCKFPKISSACDKLLEAASTAVGPHNVYNIYDNCPRTGEYLESMGGKSMRWLLAQLREKMDRGVSSHEELLGGGYEWSCGDTYPPGKIAEFMLRKDVQKALHLNAPGQSSFDYASNGPASITLYPYLINRIRVLIYNGDADACVPYKGNEEWIDSLESQGLINESEAWRPWFTDEVQSMPSGYVTSYDVTGTELAFHFVTIRLAGHMVPMFQPDPGLTFFERFLAGKPF